MSLLEQEDLVLALNQNASQQTPRLLIEVLDKDLRIVGTISSSLLSGIVQIDANADIRRTGNFVVTPTIHEDIRLNKDGLLWLNKDIKLSVGIYNTRTDSYKYYPLGFFIYTDTSGTYDAVTNQLTINCADFVKKLDGSKNGQHGALLTKFPAYEEDAVTGEPITHNIIREAVITTLEQICGISNHWIDDIGEPKAMADFNENWVLYREQNPFTWNTIPFDQAFSSGTSQWSMLTTFRDLYMNYEMFFEPNFNRFVCQLIPGCYEDDVWLQNDFIQRVLTAENKNVDMTSVRNVCEVWGQIFETDFYTETSVFSNDVYSATVDGYDEYINGDIISLRLPGHNPTTNGKWVITVDNYATSQASGNTLLPVNKNGFRSSISVDDFAFVKADETKGKTKTRYVISSINTSTGVITWRYSNPAKLKVNNLAMIDLKDENNDDFVYPDRLDYGQVYSFKIKKLRMDGKDVIQAFLLGQWQVHALDVISDGSESTEIWTGADGTEYALYSKEYFQTKYNCKSVSITVVFNSPYAVQRVGEILDVKNDGAFANITSDSLALERARWENWQRARLTDNITISTALLLFLDVNKKISYQPKNSTWEMQYIVKSVSHDFANYTSTITMMRFYPLYDTILKEMGTHWALSHYNHGYLHRYSHEEMADIHPFIDMI